MMKSEVFFFSYKLHTVDCFYWRFYILTVMNLHVGSWALVLSRRRRKTFYVFSMALDFAYHSFWVWTTNRLVDLSNECQKQCSSHELITRAIFAGTFLLILAYTLSPMHPLISVKVSYNINRWLTLFLSLR